MLKTTDGQSWLKRAKDFGVVNYSATGRTTDSKPLPYLPKDPEKMCGNFSCFLNGDDRGSENIALLSVQTLFVREHNRVANKLAEKNPSWNDSTLYEEARRVVIAVIQHITYNEYLPIISPNNTLIPLRSGYYNGYDRELNATLYNEFAGAAFRFGHSLGLPSFFSSFFKLKNLV